MPDFMNDPRWYKDAVIYELHVRSFYDASGDGVGDFEGLRRKLPYLEGLGVNTLWLLPFLESPLRDDGYDIADYYSVLPLHGTLEDFQAFLEEAHERGMRVITELVLNHTSDQHPWFQEARKGPENGKHDWYVWSDTTEKYESVRVIFTDTEHSNWSWDQKTGRYYWHRFFSHQPDLNFDNPEVREKMKEVMFYWLDMGVDGLRLDAVPYLFEREGTTSENLPETIDYVKELRAAVDERYGPGKVLLAEANQWPEETLPYFGENDEGEGTGVQMAFNFPVMPRLYMALRRESRRPLVEMLELTADLPEGAQWALFLRNHDELTLEMVTDEERDYMYHEYAADRRFRINVGIRRRLVPLLGGERKRIELMNALLCSLKGSPIIYYGDEIGMGDDPFLGDRDGVRTPMQWSPDRNAGFSSAPHHRLFKPPVNRGAYSYEFVNVEDAEADEHSLLHFTRRLLTIRQQHAEVFGRGSFEMLPVENQSVLAFVREHEGRRVLVVANLSRYAQSVHLPVGTEVEDVSADEGNADDGNADEGNADEGNADGPLAPGTVPVELFSQSAFPAFDDEPYHLTLGPHGFYWFSLRGAEAIAEEEERRRRQEREDRPGALPLLQVEEGLENLLVPTMARGRGPERFEALLPDYVAGQRWFGAKGERVERVSVADAVRLQSEPRPVYLTLLGVEMPRETIYYALPLSISYGDEGEHMAEEWPKAALAWIDGPRGAGLLHDATVREDFWKTLFRWWQGGGRGRSLRGVYESRLADAARGAVARDVRLLTGEQSNTAAVVNGDFFIKLYRRLEPGPHPEPEMLEYLTGAGFSFVPRLLGTIDFRRGRHRSYPLGLLQEALPVETDGWHYALDVAERFFDRVAGQKLPDEAAGLHAGGPPPAEDPAPTWLEEVAPELLSMAHVLGVRTAEMHRALARASAPDLRPEPAATADADALADRVREALRETRALLDEAAEQGDTLLDGPAEAAWQRAEERLSMLEGRPLAGAQKMRLHGDYHLGQVLRADGEFYILDFEGEPARSMPERRQRDFPARDVAGMMRSFDYAARSALMNFRDKQAAKREAVERASEDGDAPGETASAGNAPGERGDAATPAGEDIGEEKAPQGYDPQGARALDAWSEALVDWCQALFLDGYTDTAHNALGPAATTASEAEDAPADGEPEAPAAFADIVGEERALLWAFRLDKALYEVRYELNHRPSWTWLPLRGLERLLSEPDGGSPAASDAPASDAPAGEVATPEEA